METLKSQGGDDTPSVYFDKDNGVFEISGRSLPEDVVTFFSPIMDWVTSYSEQPNPSTDFIFKLDYFNTSSSKLILDLIVKLKSIPGTRIIWYYLDGDEEILEAGEEFSEQVDIPFEFRKH